MKAETDFNEITAEFYTAFIFCYWRSGDKYSTQVVTFHLVSLRILLTKIQHIQREMLAVWNPQIDNRIKAK